MALPLPDINPASEDHPEFPIPTQAYIEPDGYKLGSWAIVQRTTRDKGALSLERQQRLEALRGWSWEPLVEAWDEHYEELLAYVAEHGTSRVRQSYKVNGFRLGGWVHKQRNKYAEGKLSKDRQHRLETLPEWRWSRFGADTKSKRLSADDKAKFRRLAAGGRPVLELAAEFGIGRSTAYRLTASERATRD